MSSPKKPDPPKRRNHDLSQLHDDPTTGYGADVGGDSDLEAELAAIAGGGGGRPKAPPKPKAQLTADLDRMVADSLRDVGSDDDDDADLENDTDLMGELQNIADGEGDPDEMADATESVVSTETSAEQVQTFLPTTTTDTMSAIQQRINMYKQAKANAKAAGESAKARRFARGLKTLMDLLKQAKSGKDINVDDIPPEVVVKPLAPPTVGETSSPSEGEAPKVPTRVAPIPPTTPPQPETPSSPPPESTQVEAV